MKLTKEIIEENCLDIMVAMVRYFFSSLKLMYRLCVKLNMKEEQVSEDMRIRIPQDLVTGELDNEWEYMFHGYQCKFYNIKSGQVVDVQLKNYGYLPDMMDPGFFLKYLQTTPKYSNLVELFGNDYENSWFAVHTLLEDHSGTLDITSTYTEVLQAKNDNIDVPLTQEGINTFLSGRNNDDNNKKDKHREILSDKEIDALIEEIKKNCPVIESEQSNYLSQEEITELLDKIVEDSKKKDDE